MQGEPNKCINCQGSHTAISKDCPHILKHEHIIGLAAAENIPIADARKIVNSYGNHVPRSNLYLNSGNFPALRTHNRAEGHPNFESHNSFNLLQNNETSNTSRLYADAVRSQIHPQQRVTYSQRSPVNNSPPVFGTAVHSKKGSGSQPLSPGYDRDAHRDALWEPNGRPPQFSPDEFTPQESSPPLDFSCSPPSMNPTMFDSASLNQILHLIMDVLKFF
ncbi:hypothetical protein ALC57_11048 [Trachymyrmex cornetzi]|uniref:Uncharacterized protein n=1 Tax=Trachymyrmex cornetzi TaxID=471704 RepID=A0A151J312_9HYME|nr:hypothetical protein ALC57_11048 [Trachymyrmex cornetzi]